MLDTRGDFCGDVSCRRIVFLRAQAMGRLKWNMLAKKVKYSLD